jgi:CotS family spore coat protein
MNTQIYEIASHFGIIPKTISKSKYFNIIHSKGGIYSLCSARPSPERLMFLHNIKEGLIQNGFTLLDRYITTDEGLPYYISDGTVYTMTEFYSLNELDFENNSLCLKALESISLMHHRSPSATPTVPLLKPYESGIEKLHKIKKIVWSKKSPSDMDLLFRKTFDTVYSDAKNSLETLTKSDFNGSRAVYTHNSLKEDNLIYHNGRVYIIDWDNACIGSPFADLAFFIRRYIRKNAYYAHINDSDYLTMNDIISTYVKQNPLTKDELKILLALLMYPSRYTNIMEDIYKKQRSFIPSSLTAKAYEITAQHEFTSEYIGRVKV